MESNLSPDRRFARLQAATGLVVATFVVLHLANLAFALKPGGYDEAQRWFRLFYQQRLVEPVLALALVLHAGAGIRRFVDRRGRRERPSLRVRAARLGGWFLLAVMAGHIGATRISALVTGHPPGARGLGFTLEYLPFVFGPYYLALGLVGLHHLATGVGTATRLLGPPARRFVRPAEAIARVVGVVGVPIVVFGLLGLAGVLYATPDPFAHPFAAVARDFLASLVAVPTHR